VPEWRIIGSPRIGKGRKFAFPLFQELKIGALKASSLWSHIPIKSALHESLR